MSSIFLNSFSTSTCFVLFELILLFKSDSLLSKSFFFTKSAISLLLTKFACLILQQNFLILIISNFLFNFINFCVIVLAKLLTLGILFSMVSRAVLVAKFVILGTSPLTSFILALRVVLVATLVMSGILSSIFFILALYSSF